MTLFSFALLGFKIALIEPIYTLILSLMIFTLRDENEDLPSPCLAESWVSTFYQLLFFAPQILVVFMASLLPQKVVYEAWLDIPCTQLSGGPHLWFLPPMKL